MFLKPVYKFKFQDFQIKTGKGKFIYFLTKITETRALQCTDITEVKKTIKHHKKFGQLLPIQDFFAKIFALLVKRLDTPGADGWVLKISEIKIA